MTETENIDQIVRRLCSMEAPLHARLAEFAAFERAHDRPFAEAYDELVQRLARANTASTAPNVGDVMPPFALYDADGNLHQLDDYLAKGPVVVSFNRGHWCPYCLVELSAFKQGLARIASTGSQVVSIMPDSPEYIAKLTDDVGNAFAVLSDTDNGYALSLDLVIWLGERLKRLFNADKIYLDKIQNNGAWFVPLPATFVVGEEGHVVARFIDPDFRKRMDIDDIIEALKPSWT